MPNNSQTLEAMNCRQQGWNAALPALAGQRLTLQRLLLLDLIHQGGHLDAEELYQRAKEKEPRISMSTVYRNLRLFIKQEIVEEHHFNKGRSCYEVKTGKEHYHLTCLDCGRIVDLECSLDQETKESLEVKSEFHITGAKVYLEGYCADCFALRRNRYELL